MPKPHPLIILLTLLLLTACSAPEPPVPTPGLTAPPEPDRESETADAYRTALDIFCFEHTLPDGQYIETGAGGTMEDSRFAVCDVDGDGHNELIIQYNGGSEADKVEAIYGYDEEKGVFFAELRQFPDLTYYDNGIIKAKFSNNMGLAGRFWPYFLYNYNCSADAYECAAMADAWDGTLYSEDLDGRPFPSEIDTGGEGIVYYLLEGEDTTLGEPVDKSTYETWLKGYIGGARERRLPKIPLDPAYFDEGAGGTERLWLSLDGSFERNYYSEVTTLSKAEVERAALEVRHSILTRDWPALAEYIDFPLSINGVRLISGKEYYAEAPELLTGEDFTSALVAETCEEMFFNSESIVMAGGRVHLGEPSGTGELRVIAINTHG